MLVEWGRSEVRRRLATCIFAAWRWFCLVEAGGRAYVPFLLSRERVDVIFSFRRFEVRANVSWIEVKM